MSGRNWEPEDGMGFSGLVPTVAEKREESDRQRAVNREIKLREQLAASQREREQLQAILGNEEVLFRAQCYVEMIRDNPTHSDVKKWALLARAEIAAVRSILKSSTPAPVQAEGEENNRITDADRLYFISQMMDGIGDSDFHADACAHANNRGLEEAESIDYLAAIRKAIDAALEHPFQRL